MKNARVPRNVVILGVVSLLTDAATEMSYPLLPLFVATLGSGAVLLGIIEGVAETTASMLKLASGIMSDRMGKRKALVVLGYTISSFTRPLIGLVTSAWQIALIRSVDRIGKGIRTSPRDALIASSVADNVRGRAYGFHRAMDHGGAVIGPFLGIGTLAALILGLGYSDLPVILRTTFLLSVIPGALAVLTLTLFVRENTDGLNAGNGASFSIRSLGGNFTRYLITAGLFTLGNSSDAFMLFRIQEVMTGNETLRTFLRSVPFLDAMINTFPDVATRAQFAAVIFLPMVWSFFHVVKVLFSTPLGALSDRIGRKRVIGIGWTIYASVYIGFALLELLPEGWRIGGTFFLFTIYAVYYAFTEGAQKAFVADLVPASLRGSAFGLFNFATGIAALPASIGFGFLYASFGAPAAFGTGAGIALLSLLLLVVMVRENPSAHK
ncbi:MAG: MFS transporter [Bacteroidetes bacterium]|nr:MFS transporter [Bacteroidota bacterium]